LTRWQRRSTSGPPLKLGITGSIEPGKDREAMAKLKLERKLGELRVKELQAAGKR